MILNKALNCKLFPKLKSVNKHFCTTSNEKYDVIIVGGGLIGTTLACSLGSTESLKEKRVLLLENAQKFRPYTGNDYSNRVSAINDAAVDLLKNVNAWDYICSARFKPVKQIYVWDASSNASIAFNHEGFQKDIACIVENNLILQSVLEQLAKIDNVDIAYGAKVIEVNLPKNGLEKSLITLKNGKTYSCDLLVGADGIHSTVRKNMNTNFYSSNYKQCAIVATVEHVEAGDNSVAWQRFLPNGPLALLPLNDNQSSLVWTTTLLEAKKLTTIPPEEFVDELNGALFREHSENIFVKNMVSSIDSLLGFGKRTVKQYPKSIKQVDSKSRAFFPLGLTHASSYVDHGVVLIGDAAHRIHPLAGQGANLGFGDIICLTSILSDAVRTGYPLGKLHHLLQYERERLFKNSTMIFGVHFLQKLYEAQSLPAVALRGIGLQATESLDPLKKFFMNLSMR